MRLFPNMFSSESADHVHRCPVPDCFKVYKTNSELRNHLESRIEPCYNDDPRTVVTPDELNHYVWHVESKKESRNQCPEKSCEAVYENRKSVMRHRRTMIKQFLESENPTKAQKDHYEMETNRPEEDVINYVTSKYG